MTVDSVQCNAPRSMTRRTTYLYPARLDSTSRTRRFVELANMARHFAILGQGIKEIQSCAPTSLVADIWGSLIRAQFAFLFRHYNEVVGYAEEIAFAAKDGDFTACPAEENDRGRFIADSLSMAFTVWDRYLHPNVAGWEIYRIPSGLELPLVTTDAGPAPIP